MTLSQELGRLCGQDWRERFSAQQRDELTAIVRTAFIDTSACILSGRDQDAVRIAAQWAGARFAPLPQSTILFGQERMSSAAAALVNAVAGHALDYDDVGMAGHPSTVLMPALWAEHERSGASGFDLVQAYAKGYAVWGELARRMKGSLHARGWHPTAVFGAIGAAAAVSALRGLTAGQCAHAISISASMAGGVIANFGSMTKPLHAGKAAEAGVAAAELAQAGFTASPDALDGKAGLLAALMGPEHVDLESALPSDADAMLLHTRPGIKKYPVCYAAHRVIDGVIDLARAHGISAPDVERIDATISQTTAAVLRRHSPQTLDEARFSLEFCLPAALVHGRLGLAQVSEIVLHDPAVRALMTHVHTHTVNTSCPIEPSFALNDQVTITLRDGRVLDSGAIRFARGHAQLPLSETQLLEKLDSCAGPGGQALAARIVQQVTAALREAA